MTRTRARLVACAVLLVSVVAGVFATDAVARPPANTCTHRVLILGAMPLEVNPLLAQGTFDPADTVTYDGRTFYVGTLGGQDVAVAMTGIGLVNAEQTTTAAFEGFDCTFKAALFSGVAGSTANIGDVMIPRRWTLDGGETYMGADVKLYRAARRLDGADTVELAQDVPVGDAACLCPGVDAATPVHMPQKPVVHVGGSGTSADTFGGKALPCIPGGGDVEGCRPCLAPGDTPADAAAFASNAPGFADPGFLSAITQPPDPTTDTFAAQDEETAQVAKVARDFHVPFLGIRAVSDGQNDPLHLPGFPVQFFVYRQLAGNNAAAVTIKLLEILPS
jgi:nucleoside phosphorylase